MWRPRALFSGIEEGGRRTVEPVSAREWGRREAAASPVWSEDKWQRVGAILGVDLTHPKDSAEDGPAAGDDSRSALGRAA